MSPNNLLTLGADLLGVLEIRSKPPCVKIYTKIHDFCLYRVHLSLPRSSNTYRTGVWSKDRLLEFKCTPCEHWIQTPTKQHTLHKSHHTLRLLLVYNLFPAQRILLLNPPATSSPCQVPFHLLPTIPSQETKISSCSSYMPSLTCFFRLRGEKTTRRPWK